MYCVSPCLDPCTPVETLQKFINGRRNVQRRHSTHSLASTLNRQSVHTSPVKQLIVRPSPTPISPSYKAAKVLTSTPISHYTRLPSLLPSHFQASKNKVIASGTYVPPKTMSRQVAIAEGKPIKASSSGIYMPPTNSTGSTGMRAVSVCVCIHPLSFLSEFSRKRKRDAASGRPLVIACTPPVCLACLYRA